MCAYQISICPEVLLLHLLATVHVMHISVHMMLLHIINAVAKVIVHSIEWQHRMVLLNFLHKALIELVNIVLKILHV